MHLPPKDGQIDWDEIEDNEFYARRINLKIYKERSLKKPPFDRSVLKENFLKAHNTDEDVVSFRKRMTSIQREEEELAKEFKRMETIQEEQKLQDVKRDQEKELAIKRNEKKVRTKNKVETRLAQF